jgi:hypothetical protein
MNDVSISVIPYWSDRSARVVIAIPGTSIGAWMRVLNVTCSKGRQMQKDLARHLIRTAFRAGRELEELLPLLKQHLSAEEYARYASKIAVAMDAINIALLSPTLHSHPELRSEIEASLKEYDKFL